MNGNVNKSHASVKNRTNDESSEKNAIKKGISFTIFDIASLPNKMDEFRVFMQNSSFDVIALNETHWRVQSLIQK